MNVRISQKVAVSVVFVSAMFMSIMDTTIVNVALPTIGRDFHVAATSVDTVSIYFLVSLAAFIPASGWLGDRLGGRRVLLGAIVVFTAGSALCGLATSLTELDVFRVLQGMGGGMLAPVGLAMLFRTFPPDERIRAASILTLPTTFAPTIGPVLGGLLTTDLTWRWVFYVNVPIGIAAFVFGALFLDRQTPQPAGRLDLPGFALSGAGLGLLMYGLSEGPIRGWTTTVVLATALAGVAVLVAAAVVELRTPTPMVDLRQLLNRMFRTASAVMFVASAAFLGTLYTVSLFLQDGRGLSPLGSGLSIFPEAVGVMSGAQLASRVLYRRLGPRRHVFFGLVGVAGSIGAMSLVGTDTSLWWMRVLMYLMGLSMAQVFVPMQAAAFATISPAATGRASTMFNAGRQLGSALGVAIFTSAVVAVGPFTRVGGQLAPNLSAYHVAFVVAAGIALAGAAVALLIRDEDAASTIPARQQRAQREPAMQPADMEVGVG